MQILYFLYPKQAYKREGIAFFIAVLFHGFGLWGMLNNMSFFINNTPTNLIVSFLLILYTHRKVNINFISFVVFAVGFGFIVEYVGVNTGLLFGSYKYGEVLGTKIGGVPLTIGLQWMVTIYCCCMVFAFLQRFALKKLAEKGIVKENKLYNFTFLFDTAFLAVFFDWVMEPVAQKLGFWFWLPNGEIPSYNYFCWFICAIPIIWCFKWCKVFEFNKFAIHLLMIQIMFFLVLRTFL